VGRGTGADLVCGLEITGCELVEGKRDRFWFNLLNGYCSLCSRTVGNLKRLVYFVDWIRLAV
jgi:hypothetical protein